MNIIVFASMWDNMIVSVFVTMVLIIIAFVYVLEHKTFDGIIAN